MTASLLDRSPTAISSSMGLDIGTSAIKLVVARNNANRLAIRHTWSAPLTPGLVENGVICNPKLVGKLIRRWAEKTGVGNLPTVFSIPNSIAALRWVSLPAVSHDERRGAAKIKVRRHLPFPVEDAYVEPAETPEGDSGHMHQSLVIAVPRAVVDSRAETILHAGFTPIAAELEAQAVLQIIDRRLSSRSVLWRNASLTIIDVGGRNTHMYVVQNQSLQFIRSVKFGSDLIAQGLAHHLDISFEEAQTYLLQPKTQLRLDGAIVIEIDGAIAIADVSSELDKLVREFLRLIRYFRSLHPERSYAGILDHLILCGGVVGLQGFGEFLGNHLGLRVEAAQPFAGLLAEVDADGFQEVSRRQEAYAVAVGLALSAIEHSQDLKGGHQHGAEFHFKRSA